MATDLGLQVPSGRTACRCPAGREADLKLPAGREAARSNTQSGGRKAPNRAPVGWRATSEDVQCLRLGRAPVLHQDFVRRAAGCAAADLAGQGRGGAPAALA